ncbi:DNA-binding protein RFX8-like isoform X2 [Lagenorhynchus albirostris]|uniref:DNA-binding protein RFX8-like isoform X2 n=1 Tax=Lagenorhynchus albirostris TaxID=27610 RepID=UPI0028EF9BA9|nr:DNA-binding protein RFX8-like isoform X2 [Lagenorhynchus albirostris]
MAEGVPASASGGAGCRGVAGACTAASSSGWLTPSASANGTVCLAASCMRLKWSPAGRMLRTKSTQPRLGSSCAWFSLILAPGGGAQEEAPGIINDGIRIKKSSFFYAQYCCLLGEKRYHRGFCRVGRHSLPGAAVSACDA